MFIPCEICQQDASNGQGKMPKPFFWTATNMERCMQLYECHAIGCLDFTPPTISVEPLTAAGKAYHKDVKCAGGAVGSCIFPAGCKDDPSRVGRPPGHGVIPGPLCEPNQALGLPLRRHDVQVLVAAAPAPKHYLHMPQGAYKKRLLFTCPLHASTLSARSQRRTGCEQLSQRGHNNLQAAQDCRAALHNILHCCAVSCGSGTWEDAKDMIEQLVHLAAIG